MGDMKQVHSEEPQNFDVAAGICAPVCQTAFGGNGKRHFGGVQMYNKLNQTSEQQWHAFSMTPSVLTTVAGPATKLGHDHLLPYNFQFFTT